MAKKELAGRDNWQTESGTKVSNAEKICIRPLKNIF